MAIFHLSVKTISRSAGRSAVAAAAYRTGQRLYDERYGQEHDYSRKGGVAETFTLAPAGAEWALDRQALWNAAERAELQRNSTVAREYELALPSELSAEKRSTLVRDFGQELIKRYGVAVDVGIHVPQDQGDSRNWHAHVLTTTRTVGPEGLGKKTRVLDARATGPGEVEALRESWAGHINRALARENIAARVDHRSYERQGVDKAPTTHMGPTVIEMEREALVAQGLPPGRGQGIVEAMSQPDFTPVTDRGRANVMASLRNRLQEWARGVEKAMTQALEGVLTRTDPMAERFAGWFSHDKAISPGAKIPQSGGGGAPEERAQRFVEHWNGLRSQHKKLFRFSDRRSRRAVEEQMRSLAETLRDDAQMQSSLRERREEIGLGHGSRKDLTDDLCQSIGRNRGLDI